MRKQQWYKMQSEPCHQMPLVATYWHNIRVTVMIHQLLTDPDNFYNHVRRTTSSISCILIYGQRGATYENFWGHVGCHKLLEIWHLLTSAGCVWCIEPGMYFVTVAPWVILTMIVVRGSSRAWCKPSSGWISIPKVYSGKVRLLEKTGKVGWEVYAWYLDKGTGIGWG